MGLTQILRQEGMQEGEAAMLLRLLEKRFGTVSEPVRARIKDADAETLLAWSERLFNCNDIDSIFQ